MSNPLPKFPNKHNLKTVCHDTAPNCVLLTDHINGLIT